ncbi:MAG TPA: DNA repair protein RadA [Candidatus Saccharimonadales bacterium]|nr:DNA repair protein RadA [Candidatus Saccharimonadales bacterium]
MSPAKAKTRYVCASCGAVSSTWAGKCPTCDEWNTISEEPEIIAGTSFSSKGGKLKVENFKNVSKQSTVSRLKTGVSDVDNVLGGGFVSGSVSLIAGQPGIGKSTLVLQLAANLAANNKVLYVSGEESADQIAMRAGRLGAKSENLSVATSTSANQIAQTILSNAYDIVFVDSIQTMNVDEVSSSAGSVSQITNSTHMIMNTSKQTNTAAVIVGHVTKEGNIAGPKLLEHIVDVVLNLEGDRYGGFKILRSIKNRFGSTNEAGIFEMLEKGLMQVDNPSKSLLEQRQESDGSVVLATMEGNRPILVEVQALVNKTSYGYPKRAASGIDLNRMNLLVAMLERRTKLNLSDKDIYINIVGGIKITEPAADLAVCMAIGSAAKGLKLQNKAVVFGEVGLSGEIRRVNFADKRISEAQKLGFDVIIGPPDKSNKKINPVSTVREALNKYLKK